MLRKPLPSFHDCRWEWAPINHGWPSFKANYYANTEEYDAFNGVSFTGGKMAEKPLLPLIDYEKQFGAELSYGFCQRRIRDGSVWNVQRVGPFYSFGNFSWFQFTGLDVGEFTQLLLLHGEVAIIETFAGAVNRLGSGIAFPPIHIHHIHLSPQRECLSKSSCKLLNPAYVWFREQHGDFILANETELLPPCLAKYLNYPLELDRKFPAEVNDARAPNSPRLEFYMQLAFRWSSSRHYKPVSQLTFGALGERDDTRQLGHEAYWWVPTDQRIISIFESRFPHAAVLKQAYTGHVLFVRPHMHLKPLRKA